MLPECPERLGRFSRLSGERAGKCVFQILKTLAHEAPHSHAFAPIGNGSESFQCFADGEFGLSEDLDRVTPPGVGGGRGILPDAVLVSRPERRVNGHPPADTRKWL